MGGQSPEKKREAALRYSRSPKGLARQKRYYAEHRDQKKEEHRRWRVRHPNYEQTPKRRAWKRAYDLKRNRAPKRIAQQKVRAWRYSLKHSYGLTPKDYDALVVRQHGLCKMCLKPAPVYKKTNRLYVDHNHATGTVRGLLCQPCNLAVGWVEKNAERLELARQYLSY